MRTRSQKEAMMNTLLTRWLHEEEGQDLTEYALLIGLIVILAVAAVSLIGETISEMFVTISSTLDSVL
jgi:Flp pilus assembly pilin Flp